MVLFYVSIFLAASWSGRAFKPQDKAYREEPWKRTKTVFRVQHAFRNTAHLCPAWLSSVGTLIIL